MAMGIASLNPSYVLLDALLSLPVTPVRQRLINDLRQFHFKDEWQQEQAPD